jgi:peptide/nickel transport system permease protein
MSRSYILFRLMTFVLVLWTATTINFLLPRLAPGDPIAVMLERMEAQGESTDVSADFIAEYRARFGLDQSILTQYGRYLLAVPTLDFGYSISAFPTEVRDVIGESLPWSIALLSVTTAISFVIGVALGAVFSLRRTPAVVRLLTWFLVIVAPLPYYLVAIVILFLLGIILGWFPVTSSSLTARVDGVNIASFWSLLQYSALPALSIILSAIGSWALNMRAMMVTVQGEDYIMMARAKGLSEERIVSAYAIRNALLPLITQFGIALATIVSGAALVEVIFQYPGIGTTLLNAINSRDYPLIQGITFFIVLAVALGVLVIDLIYPLIDPRITYRRSR